MKPSKNLLINTIIDEVDYLVGELRETGVSLDDILDALAIYLEIAEDLDDPSQIGDLF
jgi:predicted RNase H-like nuclease